ncbi:MAG TPA: gfo/Idh/MocA family oxidoreductase, partial [Chitinophagales bacterium]|nr:gfo/Idh/MocA family oxidoreductase [Chitinophagales bacterium]
FDFLDKKAEIIRLSDQRDSSNPFAIELNTGDNETKVINFERPDVKPINSIKMELELFHDAIAFDKEPPVTLLDGYNAMNIAYQIIEKIERVNS